MHFAACTIHVIREAWALVDDEQLIQVRVVDEAVPIRNERLGVGCTARQYVQFETGSYFTPVLYNNAQRQ